jgi:hypothetical protein
MIGEPALHKTIDFKEQGERGDKIGEMLLKALEYGSLVEGAVAGLIRGGLSRGVQGGIKVLGRGSSASLSKGTTLARNLREAKAIEQAAANPGAGRKLAVAMTDPRWHGSEGWVKMQQIITPGGSPINVHYVLNTSTGAIDDFKIVLPGAR